MSRLNRNYRFLILAGSGCFLLQIVGCLTVGLGPVLLSVAESSALSYLLSP